MGCSEQGWVFDPDSDRWELRGPDGGLVPGSRVPGALAAAFGGQLNAYGARRGWPALRSEPWWQAVLADGPGQGRRQYLDPGVYPDGPPEVLIWDRPGAGIYRRQPQGCGHGRGCPWPFRFEASPAVVPAP